VEWNPYDWTTQFDPYPTFRWMRDEAPVFHNPDVGFYALTRFEDVMAAHLDVASFVNAHGTTIEGLDAGLDTLLTKDAPEHGWHRRLISRAFTTRQIGRLEPLIREVAGRLLDDAAEAGELDVVRAFSAKLPMWVISELLGIPEDLRDDVHRFCDDVLARDEATPDGQVPESGLLALFEMVAALTDVVAHRRAHPTDDVISLLIDTPAVDDAGGEIFLTDDQLAGRFVELAVAGHETVMKLVASGVVGLAWYPDQRREISHDPSLLPGAVEEMLRWEPPSQYQGRWTSRDVTLHGTTIPEASRVLLVTAAATHDDRVYDDPEHLWIHRRIDRQLGFGFGAHLCLGAPLARLETRIAFDELLARYPSYELAAGGTERTYGSNIRGLKSLPIHLGRTAARR
jgi:cytochrome P450